MDHLYIGRKVDKYDGQSIWVSGEKLYEIGNYLGHGSAGSVYEAMDFSNNRPVAIKIIEFPEYKSHKNLNQSKLKVVLEGEKRNGTTPLNYTNITWALYNNKVLLACVRDSQSGNLIELTLKDCNDIWGNCFNENETNKTVTMNGIEIEIPSISFSYYKFINRINKSRIEIENMKKVSGHKNILELYDVLQLSQDNKEIMFLILEIASGSSLLNYVRVDRGCDENIVKHYMNEILEGVLYCHKKGICHRDLKPENILLKCVGENELPIVKICDFGLSAIFLDSSKILNNSNNNSNNNKIMNSYLKYSSVGTPHYIAPELFNGNNYNDNCNNHNCNNHSNNFNNNNNNNMYDGCKSDVWSLGVILYALLVGEFPFDKDILKCERFKVFTKWINSVENEVNSLKYNPITIPNPPYYDSFFPCGVSNEVKHLLACMLHPNPMKRYNVEECLEHCWLNSERNRSNRRRRIIRRRRRRSIKQMSEEELKKMEEEKKLKINDDDDGCYKEEDKVEDDYYYYEECEVEEGYEGETTDDVVIIVDNGVKEDESESEDSEGGEEEEEGEETGVVVVNDESMLFDNTNTNVLLSSSSSSSTHSLSYSSSSTSSSPKSNQLKNEGVIIENESNNKTPIKQKEQQNHHHHHQQQQQQNQHNNNNNNRKNKNQHKHHHHHKSKVNSTPLQPSSTSNTTATTTTTTPSTTTASNGTTTTTTNNNYNTPILNRTRKNSENSFISPPILSFNQSPTTTTTTTNTSSSSTLITATVIHNNNNNNWNNNNERINISDTLSPIDIPIESCQLCIPFFKGITKKPTRFYTEHNVNDIFDRIIRICNEIIPELIKCKRSSVSSISNMSNSTLMIKCECLNICLIQVYLVRSGFYMVEFTKGQIDMFEFMRLYDRIRISLNEIVTSDYHFEYWSSNLNNNMPLRRIQSM